MTNMTLCGVLAPVSLLTCERHPHPPGTAHWNGAHGDRWWHDQDMPGRPTRPRT